MKYLGQCEVQFARHLLAPKKLVLSTDRIRGDKPIVQIFTLEDRSKILFKIHNDVRIENMKSNPREGAKDRLDVYFAYEHLDGILSILEPYMNSLRVYFDDAPRRTPDPTGMEHENGISLGYIFSESGTYIKVESAAYYGAQCFCARANASMYVETEIKRGKRFHMGIRMKDEMQKINSGPNCFAICMPWTELKRFVYAVKLAKNILENSDME